MVLIGRSDFRRLKYTEEKVKEISELHTIQTQRKKKMFTRIQNFVKKNTFVTFLVLAYALSWWPWLWAGYVKSLGMGMFPWGPSIAAIIVTAIISGKAGLKALFGRAFHLRLPVKWYVLALGLPIVVTGAAALLNVFVLGAAAPAAEQLSAWPEVIFSFPIVFLVGGAQEELGWRGFALPRFQKKFSPIVSTIFVAAVGIAWHLPLFLIGDIEWPDVWAILAAYTVITCLYNSTRGSVLLIMLMHAMNNAFSGEFISPMFVGQDLVGQYILKAAMWTIVAVVAVILSGGPARMGRRDDVEVEQVNINTEPVPYNA